MSILITIVSPLNNEVAQILEIHHNFCTSTTPADCCHVMNVSQLISPQIEVFAARLDGKYVGVGALRVLNETHGELKSMHTLEKARGQGVGRALVEHISNHAKTKGITRLSLETGTNDAFRAARELYFSMGFEICEPFGDYSLSENNLYMTKVLSTSKLNLSIT